MKIEDSFVVAASPERVWACITDPEAVGPCIPGCAGIEVTGPRSYKARVAISLGPIRTAFNLEVEVTEERPPAYAASVTRGEEGTRASVLTARNELRLEANGDGTTEVHYSSEVSLVGRLGNFGLGVMKKKAKSLGADFAEAFRTHVEASEAA